MFLIDLRNSFPIWYHYLGFDHSSNPILFCLPFSAPSQHLRWLTPPPPTSFIFLFMDTHVHNIWTCLIIMHRVQPLTIVVVAVSPVVVAGASATTTTTPPVNSSSSLMGHGQSTSNILAQLLFPLEIVHLGPTGLPLLGPSLHVPSCIGSTSSMGSFPMDISDAEYYMDTDAMSHMTHS